MKRAALYIRVSTEEQAMHGYSLDAQKDSLTKYAKEHDLFIVDYYMDEGKSARKKYTSRPEFMRLLHDVKADKLDLILFIKLDRWFRSIKDYYKVQEILDAHHVSWQTTEEHYDTTTTNGRLYTNIQLSLAQDEADRTSDRIKFVFEAKIAQREVITGRFPPGFMVRDKHLVHDPKTVGIVRELFNYYATHGSKHGAVQYIYDTYGLLIDRHAFQKMLNNPLFKGEFRGIKDYCEPIIDPDLFDRLASKPTARANATKRIYIFSGLVYCAECGSRMTGRIGGGSCNIIYYRCNRANDPRGCVHHKLMNENIIEDWLLGHLEDEIRNAIAAHRIESAKHEKPIIDRAAIKRKLSRLKELYVNDAIDMDEYKKDYDKYTAQLAAIPEPATPRLDIQALQGFLDLNFKASYKSLDREERRSFWRGIVMKIHVDMRNNITISFT